MEPQEEYKIAEWVRSDEWKTVKGKLLEYMTALESVNLLDDSLSNELVGQEAKVRSKALRLVLSWIADIEGIEERQREPVDKIMVEQIVIKR